MSYGGGSVPGRHDMLASEDDREATQAVLKQAFEDERLTQDEFEARIGKAVAARTQGDLAALTEDIPRPAPPPRRGRGRIGLLAGGVGGLAAIGIIVAVLASHSGNSQNSGNSSAQNTDAGASQPPTQNPGSPGPGQCPVGTSGIAVTIGNALAQSPVYVDPGSSLITSAQVTQLVTEIGQVDPGRIRIAVVTPATVKSGGGESTLANAISSCSADGAGTTIVTTTNSTFLVTSYADDTAASSAVGAALNTHSNLGAGLLDAVHRLAVVDKASS